MVKKQNNFTKRWEDRKLIYARGVKIKHVAKRCEINNLKLIELMKMKFKKFFEKLLTSFESGDILSKLSETTDTCKAL